MKIRHVSIFLYTVLFMTSLDILPLSSGEIEKIEVDLAAGAFLQRLPFDTDFLIKGTVGSDIQRVEIFWEPDSAQHWLNKDFLRPHENFVQGNSEWNRTGDEKEFRVTCGPLFPYYQYTFEFYLYTKDDMKAAKSAFLQTVKGMAQKAAGVSDFQDELKKLEPRQDWENKRQVKILDNLLKRSYEVTNDNPITINIILQYLGIKNLVANPQNYLSSSTIRYFLEQPFADSQVINRVVSSDSTEIMKSKSVDLLKPKNRAMNDVAKDLLAIKKANRRTLQVLQAFIKKMSAPEFRNQEGDPFIDDSKKEILSTKLKAIENQLKTEEAHNEAANNFLRIVRVPDPQHYGFHSIRQVGTDASVDDYLNFEVGYGNSTGRRNLQFFYTSVHAYFVAVDEQVPISRYKSLDSWIWKRLSVFFGLTVSTVKKEDSVQDLFGQGNIIYGLGYRGFPVLPIYFFDKFRFNLGYVIYKVKDENPVISKSRTAKDLFWGVSLDFELEDALGKVAKIFGS